MKYSWCLHRQHGIPAPLPRKLSNPFTVTGLVRVREVHTGWLLGQHVPTGNVTATLDAWHRCDQSVSGLAFMPLSGVCCDSVTSSRLFCLWRRGRRMECCPVTDDRLPFAVHFPCACAPEMGRWIRLFHGAETGFALASLVDLHLLSSEQHHFEHQHIHTVLRTPPVEINSDPTSFSSIVKFDAPIAAFVRAHPHPSKLRGPLLFGPVLTWPALFPEGLAGLQFSPSHPLQPWRI